MATQTSDGTYDSATVNTLPDWYNQYGTALAGAGLGVLANATDYKGLLDANGKPIQQQAGMSDQQQQAANLVGSNVGSAAPGLAAAAGTTAAGANTVAGATDQFNTANQTAAGALSQIGAASGALNSATGQLNHASGYLDPAAGMIDQGTQSAGAGSFDAFMNPYTDGAAKSIQNLADQNLKENVLPAVNATFTGAGQFGGSRNADFTNRAVRDNQQAVSNAQAQMLAQAQAQAQQNYLTQQGQKIQGGTALGGLATVGTGIAAGHTNVAGQQINQGQASGQIGSLQAGIGNDMVNQGATQAQIGSQQANQAMQGQQANINDENALLTTGGVAQSVQQGGLTAAYNAAKDTRDYPLQTIGALGNVLPNISGHIQPNTQTSSVSQPLPSDPYANMTTLLGGLSAVNQPTSQNKV